MTLVLLDTNTYLRFGKRVKPLLGVEFGQKKYLLTILKDVEKEVQKSPRLKTNYPWFSNNDVSTERLHKQVRLSKDEKEKIESATSVLRSYVLENAADFTVFGRSPPSPTDCYCLAFGQVRSAIVATDDLGMHQLAQIFEIDIWHGWELLKKMLSAKKIDKLLVVEIYDALENNNDLPQTWINAKNDTFDKIFSRVKIKDT